MNWEPYINMYGESGKKINYSGRIITVMDTGNLSNCYVTWRTPLGKFLARFRASKEIQDEPYFLDYCIELSDDQYSKFKNNR